MYCSITKSFLNLALSMAVSTIGQLTLVLRINTILWPFRVWTDRLSCNGHLLLNSWWQVIYKVVKHDNRYSTPNIFAAFHKGFQGIRWKMWHMQDGIVWVGALWLSAFLCSDKYSMVLLQCSQFQQNTIDSILWTQALTGKLWDVYCEFKVWFMSFSDLWSTIFTSIVRCAICC